MEEFVRDADIPESLMKERVATARFLCRGAFGRNPERPGKPGFPHFLSCLLVLNFGYVHG